MTCGDYIGNLLHGVTIAHVLHLKTDSTTRHEILGDFYEDLGPLVDKLAECYQGAYGVIDDYPAAFDMPDSDDPLAWLEDFSRFVRAGRSAVGDDTELQNLADEVQAHVDKTLGKLRRKP